MKYIKLKDVCKINMGQSPDSSSYNESGEGIPFFQGNADFGDRYPVTRIWCSEPKKVAQENDILISVRAPIGAINYSKEKCCIGRGLAALTVDKTKISEKLLFWVLKAKKEELNRQGTGSTFKAISKKSLEELLIPQIDIKEQEKDVEILEKIYMIIQNKHKELKLLTDLISARFVEMFGDPVSNSFNLPEKTLPELGEFGRGVSKHRPRNDPSLLGGKYPLIQTGEVASAGLYIDSYCNTYSELGLQQSKMWEKGTLCITIAANIAKTAILKFDACFPDSVVGFKAKDDANNIFIHYWFTFFQAILESQAPKSAQKNINLKILSELKVIAPKKARQDEFATFVAQVNKSKFVIHKFLYCTTHNTKSIIKPRPNTKESGKIRGGKPHADEF